MDKHSRKLVILLKEVWRRHVPQIVIPYAVASWVVVQVSGTILGAFHAPAWVFQGLLITLIAGVPVVMVLAWLFEFSPEGLIRTSPAEQPAAPTLPPELAPALALSLGDSERRQVTILSCAFDCSLDNDPHSDPERMRDTVAALHDLSEELIKRYDAHRLPAGSQQISLVFGYPHAHGDDARRAVAAGLALIELAKRVSGQKSTDPQPGVSARIGIFTGLVVVDETRHNGGDVTIIGQAMRFAAWLRDLASPDAVLIGPGTCKLVTNHYQCEPVGSFKSPQSGEMMLVHGIESVLHSNGGRENHQQQIGRDDELHLLEERWDSVVQGDGQFVLLKGEPGIGKSSLVHEFQRRAASAGKAWVLPFYCSPYESHNPLHPVIEALQGPLLHFTEKDDSGERLRKLKNFLQSQQINLMEAVPLLANLLSLEVGPEFPPATESPEILRNKTFELLLTMIRSAASKRPWLIVFEDLQWADPTTVDLLRMMVEEGTTPGAFVLCSARSEFAADWLKRSTVKVMELMPLSRRASQKLLERIAGDTHLPQSLIDRLIAETGGNPLYVEELTRALLESEAWRDSLAKGHSEDTQWLEIPSTLKDSLTSRVDALGKAKSLLQLCSVLGRGFSYDLLKAVSDTRNEAALKEELEEIVRADLLYRSVSSNGILFSFKHILIQETAYDSLLKSTRKDLHSRTARILESEFKEVAQRQPALVAYHYSEAGEREPAIRYWTLASGQSLAAYANTEAIGQARRGLGLVRAETDSPQRAVLELPLQSVLGMAMLSIHGYSAPQVREPFARAFVLCEQVSDAPWLFQVIVGLWMYYAISAQFDAALALGQRMLQLAEASKEPAQLLQAHYCLAFILYHRAEFVAARAHLETAIREEVEGCDYSSQSASRDDTRVQVRLCLAFVCWKLGRWKIATRHLLEAVDMAKKLGHPYGNAFAAWSSACFGQVRLDVNQALTYSGLAIELAEKKGYRLWIPLSRFVQAWAQNRNAKSALQPLHAGGAEKLKTHLAEFRRTGARVGQTYLMLKVAEEYLGLGMHEEAAEHLDAAWQAVERAGEYFFVPEYYRLQGCICLQQFRQQQQADKLDRAADFFNTALKLARRQESKAFELRAATDMAETLALQAKGPEAIRLLAGVIQSFEELDQSEDSLRATRLLSRLKKT